ncbi:MAG TPA: TetR family transcriptional regulator C-terminal domain-containing protein [Pseudonocardia sp.]|nr:TetR family transcriptional regulator C-terminal domain-containing protein [Pseudonocardia sp.]
MARVKKGADVRRGEILGATLELISERGIDALRGADVAAQLGISPALVFYHFESLENLVVSAFRFATERDLITLDQIVAEQGPSYTERLRNALRQYGPTGPAQSWRLWIEGWSAGLRNPALRAVIHTLDSRWRGVITDLIADGVARGEFHTADPRGAAWRLTALLDGLAVQRVAFDDAISQAEVDAWVAEALRAELTPPPH